MVFLVKTRLDKSPIHGVGVYADEFIAKGTRTWEFTPGFDVVLTKEEVEKLPPLAQAEMSIHAFVSIVDGTYVLCSDNAKFMNHSDEPNIDSGGVTEDVALRDIQPGEELTCDYRLFDAGSTGKLFENAPIVEPFRPASDLQRETRGAEVPSVEPAEVTVDVQVGGMEWAVLPEGAVK
jgi:hypothetical protein